MNYAFVALHITTITLWTTSNDNGNIHRLELRTAKVIELADHICAIDALQNVERVSAKVVGDGLRAGGRNSVVRVTRSDTLFQALGSIDAESRGDVVSPIQR